MFAPRIQRARRRAGPSTTSRRAPRTCIGCASRCAACASRCVCSDACCRAKRKSFAKVCARSRARSATRATSTCTPTCFASTRRRSPRRVSRELGGYELHLRRERTEARARMSRAVQRRSLRRAAGSFAALLEDAPSPGAARRWHSFKVSDGVDKYLKKSLKRVLKLGRRVGDEAHAKDLHRLRIRAKRLRYELEFFAFAYKSLDKAALEAKALQDLLGDHQDACTASGRLERYARSLRKHARRADAGGARSARRSRAAAGARRAPSVPGGVAPLRAQRRTRPHRDLILQRAPARRAITSTRSADKELPCRVSSSCSPSSDSRRYSPARRT